jgi:hypothetical protein
MPQDFDPNDEVGLQLHQLLRDRTDSATSPPPNLWERLRRAHWIVKLLSTVILFGAVSWYVGNQIADRVVESQRPLLSGATSQVKQSFKTNFDQGTCELKRELIQQADALQHLATDQIDDLQRNVYKRLGIPSSTTTTTRPKGPPGSTTTSTVPSC